MSEYMNLVQLGKYSGRSREWLRGLIKSGRLRAIRFKPNGPWMIKREWFDHFIESQVRELERADAALDSAAREKVDDLWNRMEAAS